MVLRFRCCALLCLALLAAAPVSAGLVLSQPGQIISADRRAGDGFGVRVALSADGSIAIAGAYQADCAAGLDCGSVYTFTRGIGGYMQEAKLTASNASPEAWFAAVALTPDGQTALVGAPRASCAAGRCGEAYVFVRSGAGWSEAARLTAGDAAHQANFGLAIALSADGQTALIGAPPDRCSNHLIPCGAVYVFANNGGAWSQQARLSAGLSESFGQAVALSADGSTVLAGAKRDACNGGSSCGRAYLWRRNGTAWVPEQLFVGGQALGASVALSPDGNSALIAAPATPPSGGAFLFTRGGSGTWTQEAMLTTPGAPLVSSSSVSLSAVGDVALIGVQAYSDSPTFNPGHVYAFQKSAGTWQETARFTPTQLSLGHVAEFVALSADGTTAIVNAPEARCPGGSYCGAALVFDLTGGSPSATNVPTVGPFGLTLLAVLLAAAGSFFLRRRAVRWKRGIH